MKPTLKNYLKRLSSIGLEVNYALDSGLSIASLNIGRARHWLAERSQAALSRCLSLKPATVLVVGSGGGQHAAALAAHGAQVNCIDFGTSVYAQRASVTPGVEVTRADFGLWAPDKHYDLVWASHILQHQRNVGQFIAKLIACCTPGGRVAITMPCPHPHL
jgi:2-polyprenyl-3-methyl-5-hydroxy-6-metoxy-1,4-benzoquinol methylase